MTLGEKRICNKLTDEWLLPPYTGRLALDIMEDEACVDSLLPKCPNITECSIVAREGFLHTLYVSNQC